MQPKCYIYPQPPKNVILTAVNSSCYFKGSRAVCDPDPEEEDKDPPHYISATIITRDTVGSY
jgi:hypothetical protein